MAFDYGNAYEYELEQRDRLRAAATTPIWVLTLLGTVAAYTILKFRYANDIWTGLFSVPIVLGLVSLSVAMYFLIRALHGHTYKAIGKAESIRQYEKDLHDWHQAYGDSKTSAEPEFRDYLNGVYAEAADTNATLNQIRSEYYFLCYRYLIASLVFIGFAVIPFVVQQVLLVPQP